jgi:hypothetical protein
MFSLGALGVLVVDVNLIHGRIAALGRVPAAQMIKLRIQMRMWTRGFLRASRS